jgi:hypothetical protein
MNQALIHSPLEIASQDKPSVEVIDSKELARRFRLPESWVRDRVRSRTDDPLPHVKFGRYVRFEWGSRELVEWWARHRVSKQGRNGGGH